jgi:hypothetical protein
MLYLFIYFVKFIYIVCIFWSFSSSISLNEEILKTFPLRLGIRVGCLPLFDLAFGVLSREIRLEKTKIYQNQKWRSKTTSVCRWHNLTYEKSQRGRAQWLKPIILPTEGAEIRRMAVQGQPRQNVHEIPWQTIVCVCHPSYTGTHKQKDHDTDQPEHKARPYLK